MLVQMYCPILVYGGGYCFSVEVYLKVTYSKQEKQGVSIVDACKISEQMLDSIPY